MLNLFIDLAFSFYIKLLLIVKFLQICCRNLYFLFQLKFPYDILFELWGCSSAGRAPALQAGGREFDPHQLHIS